MIQDSRSHARGSLRPGGSHLGLLKLSLALLGLFGTAPFRSGEGELDCKGRFYRVKNNAGGDDIRGSPHATARVSQMPGKS
ncbi:hypothetical protein FKM82_024167 [Ascaphus truei]